MRPVNESAAKPYTYSYQAFPKVVYHADKRDGMTVSDAAALEALGPGWVEHPSELPPAAGAPVSGGEAESLAAENAKLKALLTPAQLKKLTGGE